jgi:hypothetical protein
LTKHARKIKGRENIDLAEMSCRYLMIRVKWQVARAEGTLIEHYDPPWNTMSGFGSNPPGAGRPGLPGYQSQWDQLFPLRGRSADQVDSDRG